jgi:hypothetical protein
MDHDYTINVVGGLLGFPLYWIMRRWSRSMGKAKKEALRQARERRAAEEREQETDRDNA